MQERQWMKSHDAVAMLEWMPEQPRERKLRLFGCACCRHFERWLNDGPFKETIETAEAFADGQASKAALKRARQSVRAVRHALPSVSTEDRVEWVALWLAEVAASENAFDGVADEIQRFASEGLLQPSEQPPAALLLRCITGNPFHAVAFDSGWRTSEVITLAQSIYHEAAFDRLPQLTKELTKAGCTDTVILKHCRNKGPHGRECWVVDELLGQS